MVSEELRRDRNRRRWDNDSGDQRNEAQRDRDRLIYCQEFRRLAGVTQVVQVGEGHPFHNRLTHSLKVAQVGRRLAEHLLDEYEDNEDTIENVGGINPDVVETAALAHDLGHPPFGHPVEKELDEKTVERGVIQGFQGNAQSFRIVTKLAKHKPGELEGLDLTRASLNAILKYPWPRRASSGGESKWGFYFTEEDDFEFARELPVPGDGDGRSVEAEIMDWADDITYAIHDVADFYKAGLIPLGELVRESREREEFLSAYFDERDEVEWDPEKFLEEDIKKIGKLVGNGKANPLLGPYKNTRRNRAAVNFISSELVERYMGLVGGLEINLDPEISGGLERPNRLIEEIDLLGYLAKYYVFDNPALVTQRHGHRMVVGELFDILFDACEKNSAYSDMIPAPFHEDVVKLWGQDLPEEDEHKHRARIVADIISSLTEPQTLRLYGRVTGRSPGSIRDQLVG